MVYTPAQCVLTPAQGDEQNTHQMAKCICNTLGEGSKQVIFLSEFKHKALLETSLEISFLVLKIACVFFIRRASVKFMCKIV